MLVESVCVVVLVICLVTAYLFTGMIYLDTLCGDNSRLNKLLINNDLIFGLCTLVWPVIAFVACVYLRLSKKNKSGAFNA